MIPSSLLHVHDELASAQTAAENTSPSQSFLYAEVRFATRLGRHLSPTMIDWFHIVKMAMSSADFKIIEATAAYINAAASRARQRHSSAHVSWRIC